MNWYVTYNEPPNGLYQSQVVETLRFVDLELGIPYKLFVFVSLRGFWQHRREFRKMRPGSVVLPSIPAFRLISFNALFLVPALLWNPPPKIVSRGPLATTIALAVQRLALFSKPKVVFDARGLADVENKEYGIYPDHVGKVLFELEHRSLEQSDKVSIITDEMFNYWKSENPALDRNRFITVPCTLSEGFCSKNNLTLSRGDLGFRNDQILLCYIGSTAKWQSFDQLVGWCEQVLRGFTEVALLFICQEDKGVQRLKELFPDRVKRTIVPGSAVYSYLKICDYGLLMRGESVTNSVSSPTKTAEYLAAGLAIITNENVAVSRFVKERQVGIVLKGFEIPEEIKRPGHAVRESAVDASTAFLKSSTHIREKLRSVYG